MAFKACSRCTGTNADEQSDVEIIFRVKGEDKKYLVYKMVGHYISGHGYSPDQEFIDAVLHGEVVTVIKVRTKSIELPATYVPWYQSHGYIPIGYLNDGYVVGGAPPSLVLRLKQLMLEAEGESTEI